MALTIRHGFDHDRRGSFQCIVPRLSHRGVDGEEIVPVHPYSGHAVAWSAGDDAVSGVLIVGGGGDGVAVVAAEEDHGGLDRGGEVACGVEVDGGCGSFSEVGDGYGCFFGVVGGGGGSHVVQFQFVRRPDRLSQLGPQRTADGVIVQSPASVMNGHLPSPSQIQIVGEALIAELLEGETPPHEDSGFTILSEDVVLGAQGGCRANVDGFFTVAGHVEGDASLSLGIVEDGVHFAKADHLAVGSEE
mmetsp:Transcript_8862/g.18410  ORF Transcript_8862/g.18410 Transcript_8862/m.18410 type:complete len:246 (+) Transcript_8862:507-1244(+)